MLKGVSPKGYIHKSCEEAYEATEKQKQIDRQQFNDLYDYIRDIHEILEIPSGCIKRLRDIKDSKKITFKLILDAYKLSEEKLRWFIKNVIKDGKDNQAISAAITMVMNSGLNQAWQNEKVRIKREEEIKTLRENYKPVEERQVSYHKKENAKSISDFL